MIVYLKSFRIEASATNQGGVFHVTNGEISVINWDDGSIETFDKNKFSQEFFKGKKMTTVAIGIV